MSKNLSKYRLHILLGVSVCLSALLLYRYVDYQWKKMPLDEAADIFARAFDNRDIRTIKRFLHEYEAKTLEENRTDLRKLMDYSLGEKDTFRLQSAVAGSEWGAEKFLYSRKYGNDDDFLDLVVSRTVDGPKINVSNFFLLHALSRSFDKKSTAPTPGHLWGSVREGILSDRQYLESIGVMGMSDEGTKKFHSWYKWIQNCEMIIAKDQN